VVALQALAEQIWQDTLNDAPLRLLHTRPESADVDQPAPARFIACRALTVAQLVATLSRQDIQLQQIVADAILAALLHDVGLMRVPLSVLAASGPLDANGRIALEAHPRTGAQLISEHLPSLARLATPILCHHERPDGSGYPSGLRSSQLPLLARMLAVADCYTDLVTPTPAPPRLRPTHGPDRYSAAGRARANSIRIWPSGCWGCRSIRSARSSNCPTGRSARS
jgi:hypothetical protein